LTKYKILLDSWRRRELEERFRYQPDQLDIALNNDITSGIKENLRTTIDHPRSFDVSIIARKGKGKSHLALFLVEMHAILASREINWEMLFFSVSDAVNGIQMVKERLQKTCVMLDERTPEVGMSSFANYERLMTFSETMRKRSINFIMCSPKLRYQFEHDYILEPLAFAENGYLMSLVLDKSRSSILGCIYTPDCSQAVSDIYEGKKEEWLDRVQRQDTRQFNFGLTAKEIIEKNGLQEKWDSLIKYKKEKFDYDNSDSESKKIMGKPEKPDANFSKGYMDFLIATKNPNYTDREGALICQTMFAILRGDYIEADKTSPNEV
jgi:hypothetical protein